MPRFRPAVERVVITTYEDGLARDYAALLWERYRKSLSRTLVITEKGRAYLRALKEGSNDVPK